MADEGGRPTVLIVDDEPEIVELYTHRLQSEFDIRTAYGGLEAVEVADESVDVVLLDRRMPELSGDEVLRVLRERGLDCRVIMTTAVDPGLDIVSMPFDDYLCKPIDHGQLKTAIEQQLRAVEYDEGISAYFAAVAKLQVLESSLPQPELERNEEYVALQSRAAELREATERTLNDLDPIVAFQQIDRAPGGTPEFPDG